MRFTFGLILTLISSASFAWGPESVNASEAWASGLYGEGITIALIDTGVELSHPSLVNNLAYNDGERGIDVFGRDKRFNNVDDDQNGLTDDWAGYDFANRTGQMVDVANYGTMLAGVIVGEHADTAYVANKVQGIAPKAKILPIKFIGNNNTANNNDIIAAIDYAVARGAKIINAGWTLSQDFPAMRQKIKELSQKGILFVSSAGDNSRDIDVFPVYPASYGFANQIVVGAHLPTDNKTASFTNFGQNAVQLMAPGVGIFSSTVGQSAGSRSGSGMASAFVSGAAAVLWSFRPQASMYDIMDAIVAGTQHEMVYKGLCWSEGRLDIKGAIDYLENLYPTNPDL